MRIIWRSHDIIMKISIEMIWKNNSRLKYKMFPIEVKSGKQYKTTSLNIDGLAIEHDVTRLKLIDVKKFDSDAVWIRYQC